MRLVDKIFWFFYYGFFISLIGSFFTWLFTFDKVIVTLLLIIMAICGLTVLIMCALSDKIRLIPDHREDIEDAKNEEFANVL